jgi:transposase
MDGMEHWPAEAVELIKKQQQEIEALKKRIKELENLLKLYQNPHTPSSRQRFKRNIKDNSSGKHGGLIGHHGATRIVPEPDEVIPVTMDMCPHCGSMLGDSINVESRIIEEIPPPAKIHVTRYDLHQYNCPVCGISLKATHPDCPIVGGLGVRLMTQITLLRFQLRGVLRRIQEFLKCNKNFDLSATGVNDVLLRVGYAFRSGYDQLFWKIRKARYVYIDETCIRVLGKNWWLWVFRTDTDDVLVVIRKSRGRDVLVDILGENFKGAGINDGWNVYHWLTIVQRCWAHLLREVDDFKEPLEHEKLLSDEMHKRFDLLKDFIGKDLPMDERLKQKEKWDKELQKIVDKYIKYPDVRAKVQYIKNGLGCWYTCLLYPGMQPTNNLAEQPIREHVIIEKIIGTFRSVKGPEIYQYISSLLATWRLQGKNIVEETENLLRRELCLSKA